MSYTLVIQQPESLTDINNPYQTLSKMLHKSSEYEVVWMKHFQNFYGQDSSYFIVIQTNQNSINKQKNIRIRKTFGNQSPNIQSYNQNRKSQQRFEDQKQSFIQCTLNKQQIVDENRIVAGNFIHQNAFIVLNDPFQLYFLTNKSKTVIKIILEHAYDLTNLIAWFSFETNDQQKKKQPFILTLFGFDKNTQTNKLLSMNLMTFDVKQINQSKDYSPKSKQNHFKMFHDDRLYVFGGQNQQEKEIQQLLWSFDLEKGYWFALEMNYKEECQFFDKYVSTVYDSGKIIIFQKGIFYLLEIYQCKIYKIKLDHSKQFEQMTQKQRVLGMITFQKKVYFYTKNSILFGNFSLQKNNKITANVQNKKEI